MMRHREGQLGEYSEFRVTVSLAVVRLPSNVHENYSCFDVGIDVYACDGGDHGYRSRPRTVSLHKVSIIVLSDSRSRSVHMMKCF